VFAASLDISKAFDRVMSYCKLFSRLLEAGVPWYILLLYGKLSSTVRWNGVYSSVFFVHSGVRQGSTLSPALFNLFIDAVIVSLTENGVGCWVKQTFVGCILYADDIILLSPSLQSLHDMLNVCTHLHFLQFNANKYNLIAFGPAACLVHTALVTGTHTVSWSKCVKYLSVHLISGKKLSYEINPVRCSFFAACNAVCSQSKRMDSILQLSLMESYCLPYASSVIMLRVCQLNYLNRCWNSVYCKIFGFNHSESFYLWPW